MDTIPVMNPDQMCRFFYWTAYKANKSVMAWGPPGSGKTYTARALTKMVVELDGKTAELVDIRGSQYASVDFRGLPRTDDDMTVWNLPSTMPFKGNKNFNGSPGHVIILMLDEITSSQPPVQAVMYQLVDERCVGEHVLMDNVIVIAAGNRDGDKGVTTRMALPLCNRFTHVEMAPSVEQWAQDYAPAVGLCPKRVAYFRWRQENFNTFDPTNPNLGKAFATPRSVEGAIRYDMDPDTPADVRKQQVAGIVGTAVATDFYAFMDLYTKVVPLSEIIADPEHARMPPADEIGLTYATIANVSGSMNKENVDQLHKYIMRFPEEFIMLGWLTALRRDKSLNTSNGFIEVATKFKDTFSMALR